MLITFKVLILLAVRRLEATIVACFAHNLFSMTVRKLLIKKGTTASIHILNYKDIIIII